MDIIVKSKLLKALPGAVEKLFNSDDATNFFKGVTRVTDDPRKVRILSAMSDGEPLTLPEVVEAEGCVCIALDGQGAPTMPVRLSLPGMAATWPRMAAYRTPGSRELTDMAVALPLYDLPNVTKLTSGTFEGCSWPGLAETVQDNTPTWWANIVEIEPGAFAGIVDREYGESRNLALPSAKRIGQRIFGTTCQKSDMVTLVWFLRDGDTSEVSASAFDRCGLYLMTEARDFAHEEIEQMPNFPWGLNEKGTDHPSHVYASDAPEGADYWVVERDASGVARLVAP